MSDYFIDESLEDEGRRSFEEVPAWETKAVASLQKGDWICIKDGSIMGEMWTVDRVEKVEQHWRIHCHQLNRTATFDRPIDACISICNQ